ncbi:MAG: hypothetical protein WCI05_12105 [Myxococcales bacterium]
MFDEVDERLPPTSLRGWLSDIFLPALLDPSDKVVGHLIVRLGHRATVDDPIFGRASGLPALERFVRDLSAWLKKRQAAFERIQFTIGVDHDVSEGVLRLVTRGEAVALPIAVVAQRGRSREVELRIYYSSKLAEGVAPRPPFVPEDEVLTLPAVVRTHIEALRTADLDALVGCFEQGGGVREASGIRHERGDALTAFYEPIVRQGGARVLKGAVAYDGRTCALEFSLVGIGTDDVASRAGLWVYEIGDSGLLRDLRSYSDEF